MFKPLLAGTITDTSAIKYPVLASPKLDGIRCLIVDGKAVTRNLKPIPNEHVRRKLEQLASTAFDGELTCGDTFQSSTSAIMSHNGEPDFEYHVFDNASPMPYESRRANIKIWKYNNPTGAWLKIVKQTVIKNEADLLAYEIQRLADGYEGVMVRSLNGLYKQGRSTVKEGILLKLKRFSDSEAVIIGTEPRYTNNNEATKDALGHTKRSSHKDNLVAQDTLGALQVEWNGLRFNIGTGLNDATRAELWGKRDSLIGQLVKFKYQAAGMLEAPRFPVFLGLRDRRDV